MEDSMRITLDIDPDLLEKVVKTTGAPTKRKAIEIAMKEFLKIKHREEFNKLIGNYEEFDVKLKDLEKMRKDS